MTGGTHLEGEEAEGHVKAAVAFSVFSLQVGALTGQYHGAETLDKTTAGKTAAGAK
jgi:hypothetical protein